MKRLFLLACIATVLLLGFGSQFAYAHGEMYVVQPGDTLFTIAARYGIGVDELAWANGLNQHQGIYAGQPLVIPASLPFHQPQPNAGPFYPPPAPTWPLPAISANHYIVQPGDTLYGIASRYGVLITDLQAANWLADGNIPIQPGQPLTIPAGLPGPIVRAASFWGEGNVPVQPWQSSFSAPAHFYPAQSGPASPKWIDVDLSQQSLIAYEDARPVFRTRISSGLPQYPTVVGTFSVYLKYEAADMSGGSGDDAYFLPAVPYVMYFHGNYGLHGTYWHSNFGQPMSRGCVNLPTADAQWLFNWAPLGTKVVTHY